MTATARLLLFPALVCCQLAAQPESAAPPPGPREAVVTAIPGVIEAGAKWTLVWQNAQMADGIVGSDDGGLLFAQQQTNKIDRLDKSDRFSVQLSNPHAPGAVAIGPGGRVFALERTCLDIKPLPCTEPPAVSALTPERTVLADSVDGKALGRPNDLVAGRNGGIYFSSGGAFFLKPGGKVSGIGENLSANGIMLSPDEKTLYVTNGPVIVAFDVQADGSVRNQHNFGKLEGGGSGDGMAVDSAGRLYVCTNRGVQVLGPDGKYLGLIPTPRPAVSTAFSGPGKQTLYVACRGAVDAEGQEIKTPPGERNITTTIYKIRMTAQGFKGRPK